VLGSVAALKLVRTIEPLKLASAAPSSSCRSSA